ncbi:MAG: penicillin-insensitive murein endopeptidase [Deltaproteobacteria bacterium]|nr:penicillin-insensitive murein endopeptidase [Deltaproteobacteria bacterium]
MLVRSLLLFGVAAVCARPADAGRHTMQPGETLDHVASVYGCTTQAVLRANGLAHTLVPAGTVVVVPACRPAAVAKKSAPAAEGDDDDRARRALAVIDGASLVKRAAPVADAEPVARVRRGPAESVGEPWNGRLREGEKLPRGEGYAIRRPGRAYGAAHVVEHLRRVIAEVRALRPEVHTLAIGDLSAPDGGKLDNHHSHQSGVDVDVGLYFTVVPRNYPAQFAPADEHLDVAATWALVTAFARTVDLDTGVQVIFLDYDVQARLHAYARRRGTPDAQLAALLQYPRGRDALAGLVRHWPSHLDHLHVRFKPGR